MAYNLYQVQMAKAWAQRIDKENAQAEKFWTEQTMRSTQQQAASTTHGYNNYAGSLAASRVTSAAPTGYTSKTSFLKDRLDKLEQELAQERDYRLKVEQELAQIRTSSSKPGTPRH